MDLIKRTYTEDEVITCGLGVVINTAKCGKCHTGIDKSGICYMCPVHFEECESIIMKAICTWGSFK
jgi:hypothetical protein